MRPDLIRIQGRYGDRLDNGRKNIPIKKDTIIEELPALVLADNRDEKNFQRWAESKGFTFYEIYKFRYKEDYKIYRIKKAEVDVPVFRSTT